MTTATTNVIARVAAVVAGIGLVASAFAPLAYAQTMTTTTTASTSMTFTRDLTLGSTGADVTALQNWLIGRGHSIAAGATGYFGAQTRAALAAWQAANGVTPAAGYFGPITRARVMAMGGSTTGTTTGGNTGGNTSTTLRGGEADLSDFRFIQEESTLNEGEQEVEIGTIEFDVEDGDARIERVELIFDPMATGSDQPWRYFDRIVLMADGREIGEMDVDSRSDWRTVSGGNYRVTLTGLNYVVRDGDRAEITVAVDVASTVRDLGKEFDIWVPTQGVRATDAAGIQQYIGDANEKINVNFDPELSGDIRLRESSDNPSATTLVADEDRESTWYTVMVGELENREEVDTLITDATVRVNSLTSGTTTDYIRRARLTIDGQAFNARITNGALVFEDIDAEVGGDDTVDVELEVTLVRNAANTQIRFVLDEADVMAEGADSGTDADVNGRIESELHQIATSGLTLSARNATATQVLNTDATTTDDQGRFVMEVQVTALEDTAFIALTGSTATSSSIGTAGVYAYIENSNNVPVYASGTTTILVERVSGGTVTGNYLRVNEGQTAVIRVTLTYDAATTGNYRAQLHAIDFNDTAAAGDERQLALPEFDFQSPAVQVLN